MHRPDEGRPALNGSLDRPPPIRDPALQCSGRFHLLSAAKALARLHPYLPSLATRQPGGAAMYDVLLALTVDAIGAAVAALAVAAVRYLMAALTASPAG